MKESEAKTKWCPFSRQLVTLDDKVSKSPQAATSANRFHEDRVSTCIASACMAWRWEKLRGTFAGQEYDANDDGYCGLANRG